MTTLKTHFLLIVSVFLLGAIAPLQAKPLKVYILAGQSNMQGFGGFKTFGHIADDPKAAPMLKFMQDQEGNPVVLDDVYAINNDKHGKLTVGFGCANDKIGPEYTFGIYLHEALQEPMLLIKTAWGGKSLNRDFCPPGAIEDGADERYGKYYRMMMEKVKEVLSDPGKYHPAYDPNEGYVVDGLVWFQGYNDEIDKNVYPNGHEKGGFDLYTKLMAQLIRDMRKELDAPKMKAVIGVIGVGGPEATEEEMAKDKKAEWRWQRRANFRKAQSAVAEMPEFKGTVAAVPTAQYWDYDLAEAEARMGRVYQELSKASKKDKLSRSEYKDLQEKLRNEYLTEEQLALYWKGRSAQSFHYMGSAKIYAQVGMAMAKAMGELEEGR